MVALVPLWNTAFPRRTWVNAAPSSAVVNSAAETAFEPTYTIAAQSVQTVQPNMLLRFSAWGVMSTAVLNFGITLRLRLGGLTGTVLATTSTMTLASSLSNVGWRYNGLLIVRSVGGVGSCETQTVANFQTGGAITSDTIIPSVSTTVINTLVANDLVITAQWATADANNSIQMRAIAADVDLP